MDLIDFAINVLSRRDNKTAFQGSVHFILHYLSIRIELVVILNAILFYEVEVQDIKIAQIKMRYARKTPRLRD